MGEALGSIPQHCKKENFKISKTRKPNVQFKTIFGIGTMNPSCAMAIC
jgi:hypothetical protein